HEDSMYFRVFVLVLALPAALFGAHVGQVLVGSLLGIPAAGRIASRLADAQDQIRGRRLPDVEVLVVPLARSCAREVEAAFAPVAANGFLEAAIGPNVLGTDVPVALDDVEMCARAVLVALLIGPWLEAGDVRVDGAA